MRQILQPQIPIVHHLVDHTHGYELVVMSQIHHPLVLIGVEPGFALCPAPETCN
jgi:hypothetical protein